VSTSLSASKSAGNSATPPFSALLEQAKPSPNDPLAGRTDTDQTPVQGRHSPGSVLTKREGKVSDNKPSDSKTNDSAKSGYAITQTSSSSLDADVRTIPVALVQPQLSPDLSWNAALKDFVSGAAKSEDRSGAISGTTGHTASAPTLSKDSTPAQSQVDTSGQDSPSTASAESTNADAVKAEAVTSGVAAGPMAKLAGRALSDPKTLPGNGSLSARTTARETAATTAGIHPAKDAVKSAVEESLVPPSVAVSGQGSPAPEKLEVGNSQGTRSKQVLDKTRVGVTQESSGTNRKNVDVAGSAKAQSRKDDAPASAGSTVDDQATATTPAKPAASTTAFSVAGIQPSTSAADGKSVNGGVPHEGSDRLPGQLDQKSTGVVQSQAQGESSSPYPTSVVHSAKLVERMGETELRLGIRAGEFGSVDVRTSMVRNQFTAEISTERGELGRALAAELPSLQNRLTDQRVPVANITLQNHTGSHSAPSEQQNPRHGQQVYPTNPGSGREEGRIAAMVASEAAVEASRLDIRM